MLSWTAQPRADSPGMSSDTNAAVAEHTAFSRAGWRTTDAVRTVAARSPPCALARVAVVWRRRQTLGKPAHFRANSVADHRLRRISLDLSLETVARILSRTRASARADAHEAHKPAARRCRARARRSIPPRFEAPSKRTSAPPAAVCGRTVAKARARHQRAARLDPRKQAPRWGFARPLRPTRGPRTVSFRDLRPSKRRHAPNVEAAQARTRLPRHTASHPRARARWDLRQSARSRPLRAAEAQNEPRGRAPLPQS